MTYYRIDHAIKEFANDLADHFKNEAESWNTQKEFYEDTPAGKEKAFDDQYYDWRDRLVIYTGDVLDLAEGHGVAVLVLLTYDWNPNEGFLLGDQNTSERLTRYLDSAIDTLYGSNIHGFRDKLHNIFFREEDNDDDEN